MTMNISFLSLTRKLVSVPLALLLGALLLGQSASTVEARCWRMTHGLNYNCQAFLGRGFQAARLPIARIVNGLETEMSAEQLAEVNWATGDNNSFTEHYREQDLNTTIAPRNSAFWSLKIVEKSRLFNAWTAGREYYLAEFEGPVNFNGTTTGESTFVYRGKTLPGEAAQEGVVSLMLCLSPWSEGLTLKAASGLVREKGAAEGTLGEPVAASPDEPWGHHQPTANTPEVLEAVRDLPALKSVRMKQMIAYYSAFPEQSKKKRKNADTDPRWFVVVLDPTFKEHVWELTDNSPVKLVPASRKRNL